LGQGEESTTNAWAGGVTERYLPGARLVAQGVMTNLGILHEAGHPEPWIIAMDCAPTRAAVLDYGARWAIEPMFSDFKGRGFDLEDSQLEHTDRLERGTAAARRVAGDVPVHPRWSGRRSAFPNAA
jgi:hypothetical protein